MADMNGKRRVWTTPRIDEVHDSVRPRAGLQPAPYESPGFTSPDRTTPFPGYTNTLPPVYPTS